MDVVKQNWSGGKDSTAALILHGMQGDKIKAVYYIPYLVDGIPLITKKQMDFMERAQLKFTTLFDCNFFRARGITYYDHVTHVKTRGPNKGSIVGIGLGLGFCAFRNRSKIQALNTCNVGYYDYQDIAIASDETKRINQLNSDKRSILAESNLTERDAFTICRLYGVLSPLYENGASRDGCVICPNSRDDRLKEWARDYPRGVEILREIESLATGPKDKIYRDGTKWSDRI